MKDIKILVVMKVAEIIFEWMHEKRPSNSTAIDKILDSNRCVNCVWEMRGGGGEVKKNYNVNFYKFVNFCLMPVMYRRQENSSVIRTFARDC